MKTVAVIQSNYLPWKGYFDIVHDADVFVFYDEVQYTKNDWRNRNKIKVHGGTAWLTVPVGDSLDRLVSEVRIEDPRWAARHWKTIRQYYSRAPFFDRYEEFFRQVYLERSWEHLATLNRYLIESISKGMLGMTTRFVDSSSYGLGEGRSGRLLELLKKLGADVYVSGPSAKGYIDESAFAESGVRLVYKDYAGYPEYPQFFPPFEHAVSIIDLLFHTGPDAPFHVWGWRTDSRQGRP